MNAITATRRRITAATLALAAGATAASILALAPAAQAAPMTFAQGCATTHGWLATVVGAGIEECHWQDPNTGNEWIKKSPIGAAPISATGSPFGQACVVTQGWDAVIVAAGIEQCHWQDSDGNEHMINSPLPKKGMPPVKSLPQSQQRSA